MKYPKLPDTVVRSVLTAGLLLGLSGGVFQASAQSFSGAFEGMSQSDEPIQIEADRLEVMDDQGIAIFDGNVAVVQGTTLMKTKKLKVYYLRESEGGGTTGPGGNVKKIEATGKVAVRSGDQNATSDTATVDMQAQIAILNGNVTVSQGANILEGCNLRINMATNAANLTPCKGANEGSKGRVKMLFTPESGKQKKQ
jgi:lipopolysaccharide export system protein LptA